MGRYTRISTEKITVQVQAGKTKGYADEEGVEKKGISNKEGHVEGCNRILKTIC